MRSSTKAPTQLSRSGQIELSSFVGWPYKNAKILDGLNPIMNHNKIASSLVTFNYGGMRSMHRTLAGNHQNERLPTFPSIQSPTT